MPITECAWADRDYFGVPLRKLQPLREPDLSLFSTEELEVVRRVILDLWELNATEVSEVEWAQESRFGAD